MKISKRFIFDDKNKIYIIKVKKNNLWWLLLLLLPLLLLIPCKTNITFKTIVKNNAQANTTVNLHYTEYKLINFQNFAFFTKQTTKYTQITNQNGIAKFENIHCTVFDRIFHANKRIYANAYKDCFFRDSIIPKFYSLSENNPYEIILNYRTNNYDFKVIDSEDKEPIPNATVKGFALIPDGDTIEYQGITDPAGIVVLKNFPYCGKAQLMATAQGYDTSIIAGDSRFLYGNIDSCRTFEISSQKATIKFIVRDLKTKEPLANATAHLIINNKTVQTVQTNINGIGRSVGEGEFNDVSVFRKFTILAQKKYYNDTTLSDSVGHFVKLPIQQRTLYLRPKTIIIKFRNIDAKTKKPLSGVKNTIIINGIKRQNVEYSNSNGYFVVSGIKPTDKISIIATKLNYRTNDYTVHNTKVSKIINNNNLQTIPLSKKTVPPPPPTPPPPPPNVKPCEAPQESGGYGTTVNVHSIGTSKSFHINWDMYSVPDRIVIYCGSGTNKKKIYDSQKPVSGRGKANLYCNKGYITVVIIGPQEGTQWEYQMKCK